MDVRLVQGVSNPRGTSALASANHAARKREALTGEKGKLKRGE